MTIRVLVADDQALVRSGFRLILEAREDIEVVGEAENGAEAVELGLRLDPDVILMDVRMPGVDGVEATRRLTQAAQLVDAVRVVADGEALLAPTVTRRLLDRFARTLPDEKPPPALETLTARELEILRLVAGGLSNAEIADQLVVTEATVKTHVSSVLRKLQLRDRVQAVVVAYDAGLVHPSAR